MSNPYLDCVAQRMKSDNAVEQLHRHWSARGERAVMRVGYWIDLVSPRLAAAYTDLTWPLVEWFGDRQRTFLRRWF